MATPQQQEAIYQEGRIALAIQAYKLGQFQTPTAAAKSYATRCPPERDAPQSRYAD